VLIFIVPFKLLPFCLFFLPWFLVLIWSFSLTPGKKVHLVLVTFNREYRDFVIIFISLPKYVWYKRCLWYIILVLDLIIDMYITYVMLLKTYILCGIGMVSLASGVKVLCRTYVC
jgi:hypothetical protein